MAWRILLAGTIGASLAIAYALPVAPLSRFLLAGLFLSILARLAFALTFHLRTTFSRFLIGREAAGHSDEEFKQSFTAQERTTTVADKTRKTR